MTTNLPIWAQTNEAKRLLTSIAKNPPKFQVYEELSAFGPRLYTGTRADQLRAIFDPLYATLQDWVSAARTEKRPGRPQPAIHGERHDAVARYLREFGPDAVIDKVLAQ